MAVTYALVKSSLNCTGKNELFMECSHTAK